MPIYDLINVDLNSTENKKTKVFFQNELFKTRLIVLEPGEVIPECQMKDHVLFLVIEGEVSLKRNNEETLVRINQVFISDPALISMKSGSGARLMGVQIIKQ